MSRGGLIIYNWGIANPEKVAVIYGDAPVMDFKSWPGPTNKGILKAYGFKNAEEAKSYRGNPVDNLKPLADAGVPIIHVVGDATRWYRFQRTRRRRRATRQWEGSSRLSIRKGGASSSAPQQSPWSTSFSSIPRASRSRPFPGDLSAAFLVAGLFHDSTASILRTLKFLFVHQHFHDTVVMMNRREFFRMGGLTLGAISPWVSQAGSPGQ